MSGHSHWSSIKHQKGAADAKRSKAFSKMSRLISVAAKEGGGDPDTNPQLRMAIDQAKGINMPKDNIEKAIKRGTGEIAGGELEGVIFEAYGPGGIALIVEGITDNKNRTLGEIKQIISKYNGKLADEGSVRWMFERRGIISVESKKDENLELKAIEAGAEDLNWQEDYLEIYTAPTKLEKVKNNLKEQGVEIDSTSLGWIAKEEIETDKKDSCEALFEALDDNDAIQNIYSNLKE